MLIHKIQHIIQIEFCFIFNIQALSKELIEFYIFQFLYVLYLKRIADLPDPRERIVQVLRWYMSAYHAGRKSVVARKPYNPILGEIFQCHWNVPGLESNGNPKVPDGPVPWCSSNQLTFVAEQVSHHPPSKLSYLLCIFLGMTTF